MAWRTKESQEVIAKLTTQSDQLLEEISQIVEEITSRLRAP